MKNKKVEELVERVERNVRAILWRYFREELTPEAADDIAKEILGCDPDLALIDREQRLYKRNWQSVISLAEAWKEVNNDQTD